ncbi:Lrp/AsnC ligand binding domain-containing protein [Flammeovirga yaeyamensis]|uniref:Lrp/AsnC ligand binding domain-containing protein n=1 Tax=Flammeovirga yaeyamensis TaxID=367791 RepID=A0AAX1NA40_9BACT|nr:Lrp/AsnC family transcriptional regulator [Flammeovirga yaeyamensis]MBB3697506.1 Lrp/AsnC family leucine-responsive transcriptional regulator [Flammeovirga yaeyamensis]NMF36200.1 Lrp/AsnC family transcriptional regulator [Flammeovirga yaeyamensis]QWG02932.1 Lrp/AsnC ligand binding domain-containing protein [Flammeovirga yaeyamensis]
MDQTDKKILKLLQEDGSITTKEIARRIHLSNTPVYERIKKMEREGVIKKYVAVLNREKLDRDLIVFCNVTLKEHSKIIGHKFVEDITALEEVVECYNISGDYDFLLKVMVKDMKAYQDFVLNRLGEIENIGSAHSTFVMGEIKQSYKIPITE